MTLAEFYATHRAPRAILVPGNVAAENRVSFAPALYGAQWGEAFGAFLAEEPDTETE
jgi:hypothetical protein